MRCTLIRHEASRRARRSDRDRHGSRCALSALGRTAEASRRPPDYAAQAWSILPPGENGSLAFDKHTSDQAKLYDALTPLRGKVTQASIQRYFKPEPLGLGKEKPVSIAAAQAGRHDRA